MPSIFYNKSEKTFFPQHLFKKRLYQLLQDKQDNANKNYKNKKIVLKIVSHNIRYTNVSLTINKCVTHLTNLKAKTHKKTNKQFKFIFACVE